MAQASIWHTSLWIAGIRVKVDDIAYSTAANLSTDLDVVADAKTMKSLVTAPFRFVTFVTAVSEMLHQLETVQLRGASCWKIVACR